jgi:uncharacterized protein YehS (DUF1456 family)
MARGLRANRGVGCGVEQRDEVEVVDAELSPPTTTQPEPSMTNNDVLRRIRDAFDLGDPQMISILALADRVVTHAEISAWLSDDDAPSFKACRDPELATFLDGFIIERRGKPDGPARAPEELLTNNNILTKLKIALDLKSDDFIEILALVDLRMSKHELTALFRKPGSKHFRECQDQLLQGFLQGLQLEYRPQ